MKRQSVLVLQKGVYRKSLIRKNRLKKFILICVVGLTLMNPVRCTKAGWINLNAPWPIDAIDIDGGNIVGTDNSGHNGFLYDGTTWTTLDVPGVSYTTALGIDGGNIVGNYWDADGKHGYIYDGTTWTTLDAPGAFDTTANGIDGGNIVGDYEDATGFHSFLYDGTTWTTLDAPGAAVTVANGIDGGNIVGIYHDATGAHGFIYDGTTWTTLDAPGASATYAQGIDGGNIVGYYRDAAGHHGFIYDGTTWTTLDAPGAYTITIAFGIDGNNIVGGYPDSNWYGHGFLYTFSLIADADGPYEIYAGDYLSLDASGSIAGVDDIVSYMWDLDYDGTFETDAGSEPNLVVDFAYLESLGLIADNTYTISLQVTDSGAQSDVNESTLTILPLPEVSIIKAKMVKIPPTFTKIGLGVDLRVKFLDSNDVAQRRYVFLKAVVNGQAIGKEFDVSGLVDAGEEKDILWNDGQFSGHPLIVLDFKAAGVPRFQANEKFDLMALTYSSDSIINGVISDPNTKSVEIYLPVVIVHGYLFPGVGNRVFGGIIAPAVYDSLANYLHTKDPHVNDPNKGPFITGYTADVSPYQTIWRSTWRMLWRPNQVSDWLHALINEVHGATYADRVNIVGHSMGGLIGRYYASDADGLHPGSSNRIHKLVTIGTPHLGISGFYEVTSSWSAQHVSDFVSRDPLALWGLPRYENGSGTPIACIYEPNDQPLWPDQAIVRPQFGFKYPEHFPDQVVPPPGVTYYTVYSGQDKETSYLLYVKPKKHKGETWYRVIKPIKSYADGDGLVTVHSAELPSAESKPVDARRKHAFLPADPNVQEAVLRILLD